MTPPFDRVRRVLDRGPAPVPPPPRVYEPTARLVYTDLGLPELFVRAAARGGLAAELIHLEDLPAAVADHLHGRPGVHVAASPLLRKIRLADALTAAGTTLLAQPAVAAGWVTEPDAAVAETGSLVCRGRLPAGWSTAAARVVVLEPRHFVPDLIDLLADRPGDLTLVSGPADVRVFVLH